MISQTPYTCMTQVPSPSLNTVQLLVIHNRPCKHSSKLQLSIRFTPSRCLDVRQDWYPMYYPEGMKAPVSPVQSIDHHRILEQTRDSNQRPLGPQSIVVTTIPPLHTIFIDMNYLVHCWSIFYNISCRHISVSSNNINTSTKRRYLCGDLWVTTTHDV